jgi:hypothetical protein
LVKKAGRIQGSAFSGLHESLTDFHVIAKAKLFKTGAKKILKN